MSALPAVRRDWTWMIALATLSLAVSVWTGRYDGPAFDFVSGFFLGVALAVSVGYLAITLLRRRAG